MKSTFLQRSLTVAALAAAAPLAAQVIFEDAFSSEASLKNWYVSEAKPQIIDNALVIDLPERSSFRGTRGVSKKFSNDLVAGRRLKLSAKIKGDNIAPAQSQWNGGKFQLEIQADKNEWPGGRVKLGSYDWEDVSFFATLPPVIKSATLTLGIQDSCGKISFKDLKVEAVDTFVNLAALVNMAYADETENDGKGGWSDQGPENDGRNFDFKKTVYANVPFYLIDPATNNNKSIIVFRSSKFPAGIPAVSADLAKQKVEAKYLYLMHTLCWGSGNSQTVATITVTGLNGKTQNLTVQAGREAADWWAPKNMPNGFVGTTWSTASGGRVGMYISKYELNADLGELKSLDFKSANNVPIWLLAGVTLSENDYKFPAAEKFTLTANDVWRPVNRAENQHTVTDGSALDRSIFADNGKVGDLGRVIVNADGHLAFEKKPNKPARFLSSCEGTDAFWGRRDSADAMLIDKETIDNYAKELKRNGYNMSRTHFLDTILMRGGKADCDFNPDQLDKFDYYIYCLKQNGVYLDFDAMSSWTGYTAKSPWDASNATKSDYKYQIHFNDAVKKNWIDGVTKLLTHVNPYTKTRLVDDPVLASIVGFNEQEFAFIYDFDGKLALPKWREFLMKRYGSIDKLKAAWGDSAKSLNSFEDVKPFTKTDVQAKNAMGADVGRFIKETEINTMNFYINELRKLGYQGPVSGYNMGKSFHYAAVRNAMDAVTMNTYHAHPSNYMQNGSTISQDSSIANSGGLYRWAMGGRNAGKPFLMTEYANTFWNQYRYEQAFVTGAYGSLQGFDVLTNFAQTVNTVKVNRIYPFLTMGDPILRASEFLTYFMFRRGDLKTADVKVRITVDAEDIYNTASHLDGLSAPQSKLSLVTGFSIDVLDKNYKSPVMGGKELAIPRVGGAGVTNNTAGFASVSSDSKDLVFNADAVVDEFKKLGLVPVGNRTKVINDIYESVTGEIYMDSRKNFMAINTPNLQGICAEAKTKYTELPNFKIEDMSVKGNLTAVSVEVDKSLQNTGRIVVVYATDALNNKMVFDEKERITLRDNGTSPVLVESGKFTVTVRNDNADKFKIYALDMSGNRAEEVKPLSAKPGEVTFTVDTAKLAKGPSVYFELVK